MDRNGLSIVNPRPTRQAGPELLHHLVQSSNETTALEHLENSVRVSYSYRALHEKADALASRITHCRQASSNPDGPFVVPVLIRQSPLLYTSLLAILKAGGAFCPLNIDAPPERVKFIFKDVSATVALASAELAPSIPPETGAALITLSPGDEMLGLSSMMHRTPSPEDLAYVMYTSGSTGTPKGVGLSHSAATQALLAHDRHVPSFSRFLQFAAPTFDVSVFEIFFPLFRGSTLVSVRREELLDDLPAVLREMHVDACELTPTVASSLLRKRQNAPELKLLLTIGEMLNSAVTQEFGGDTDKESMLWAMYGPTEATIHCTLQTAFSSESSTGNIGVPLDTVSCFVIDPAVSPETSTSFNILPMGEVGELAVGGHQLATEYLNRPEQTSAVFISSPYGRVYRTGDKARMRPDGTFECLGRLSDGQVKLRGQRLELGEVEQAVMRAPGCHNAVAAVVDSILIAFCAVDPGTVEENILETCKNWLPSFMIPGEVLLMKDFPRLPSGKVDKKKLKSDFEEQKADNDLRQTSSQPLDEPTGRILQIVSETIDVKVDLHTTFSSAGIDSLRAIKLASSLRDGGFNIHAAKLLSMKTMLDLCSMLRRHPVDEKVERERVELSMLTQLNEISAQNPCLEEAALAVEDVFTCVPLQAAMLAETLRDPGAYCNEIKLEVAPPHTAKQVVFAFRELARRNEILRTGYVPWKDGFVSVLFKELPQGLIKEGVLSSGDDEALNIEDGSPPVQIRIMDVLSENERGVQVLIRIHHVAYDGWSMDMMLSDVSEILQGIAPSPRPQFREVVEFHMHSSTRDLADADRAFWTEHLLGWSNAHFPTLVGSAPGTSHTMTTKKMLDMSPKDVQQVSRQNGCSAQVLFQASLALIWSGILGSADVVMGSVTSGRSIPIAGIERVLGPCIASMPLRVNFENMSTNLDVLNSIMSSNRDILEHCILPLSEIKKLAGLQAGDSLYDVLFVYQESVDTRERKNKLIKEVRHLDRLETKLLLEVEPRDEGFAVQVTYKADWLPTQLIDCLLEQFTSAARHFLNNPSEALQTTKESLDATLSTYNEKTTEFREIPDLAKTFEAAVLRDPAAHAICFASSLDTNPPSFTTITYQHLNETSNQIARFIRAEGGTTGEVVAVVMEKSVNLYASILGIVKAGCAYLPLLPSTPAARTSEVLKQAKIKICLVNGASPESLASISHVRFLDVSAAPLENFESSNLDIPADPSRLAYVIYTSGTTGVPKGVAVTQLNIVSNIAHLGSTYPRSAPRSESRLLQACSQAFDVSVFEIFFTWHTGMCLCSGTNDVLFGDLEHAIRQFKITHLSLTPTVASLIDPKKVPNVEFLVTAGEPMTQSVLDTWGNVLWQGYGPSETTNICSVKPMHHGEQIEHLGWVFPNTSVFVLFPNSLETAPRGWVGEFCFGGDQIAHGYLNMPELTGEKFIDHPKEGRIYRSGDMGRMLDDGSLVIMGRIDDQIKLRGQRIEAGEINSVITATGLAKSAVTMLVRREGNAAEQLVSFYVPSKTDDRHPQGFEPLSVQSEVNRTILASLHSRVSSYMVPSYVIPLSQIPLTSSGKVDRKALQNSFEGLTKDFLISASDIDRETANDSIWTETELSVASVITQGAVQGIAQEAAELRRWTPFATVGLDSISAIGVARSLSSVFGVRVPVSAVLQNPSIAQLGRYLDSISPSTPDETVAPIPLIDESFVEEVREDFAKESKEVTEVLPCTPLQEAMLSSGSGSYYNKILLRLRIMPEEMRGYWDEMSRRHGVLRTCFVTTNDADHPIAQVVLRDSKLPWKTFDVSVPSFDGAIHDHLRTLPEPLDSHLPPVSLALVRYKGSMFLSFICHHALYDGVAMENLWREVEALANGNSLQPAVPYRPFIQEMLTLPSDVEAFWADHFSGFRSSSLFSRPAWKQFDQSTHTTSLDISFVDLQERLRSLGVSLLSLCQATWANVLTIACELQDVCFGNVMSGRTVGIEGIDRLVAPCFNTIPTRMDISRSSQNLDLVKHFHRLNSDLLRYQFTPLRQVQKIASRQRRGLFDTLLLLQQPLRDMDERVWTLEEDSGDMDIPLVCEIIPCPGLNSVVINMHHDMSIVTGDIATTLSDLFRHLLHTILSAPYASPTNRRSLPSLLRSGLTGVAAKKEKRDDFEQAHTEHEDWSQDETQVREVLSQLSGAAADKIRRHTSIFQLGLDSINAVQVASILRRQGLDVSASDVIECLNCTNIADRISENSRRKRPKRPEYDLDQFSRDVALQVKSKLPNGQEIEAVLPCTPMQSAMLSSFVQSDGRNYLNLMTYEVDPDVRADSLIAAWKSICTRHPMLRTAFLAVQHRDSAFAMLRQLPSSFDTPVILLEDKEAQDFSLSSWKESTGKGFLRNPHIPPWKVALVQTSTNMTMNIIIHHAMYDAQSLDGILDALSKMLNGHEVAQPLDIGTGLSSMLFQSLRDQEEAKEFWQSQASDVVVNSFPILTPLREERKVILSYETTSSMLFSDLQRETQDLNYSIQAVIQAAWTRVLSSYLGENAVVFGVTLSGRTTDETREIPIPCLTTVPVVAADQLSNADLVKYMMEYNASMHKHQFSPLSQVQKWLGHPATPVFDTLLAYQRTNRGQSDPRPWKLAADNATVEYPVSLEVEPGDDNKVHLRITFFSDVLPEEQAVLVVQQFDATVAHLVQNPAGTSDDMFKTQQPLFCIEPASSPVIHSQVQLLHQFVETRASSDPEATALEFVSGFNGDMPVKRTWSYQELDQLGNKVANMLEQHAPAGSIVALHFNKCPEAYFSILGILKAGCSFVALDPTAPKARKEFILCDSGAPCLLTDSPGAIGFETSAKIIPTKEAMLQDYPASKRDLGHNFTPESTCYCLYTSGTTGTPKGCEITHENAVQAMMAFQELFRGHWSNDSRWLQFAALHFDVSVLEQYWTWSVGITVVAAPKDLILDDLIATINRLEITHIDLTPSLARLTHPDDVPSLCKGVFITGGEQLKQEILDAWGSKAVIYNAYGPTEATIGVTMYQRVPVNGRPSNIGQQFPNVGSYVFRQGTEIPVLRGGVGELCVSGKLVGKGYLKRPELTEERFPTLAEFSERVYRTGDLVRMLHDGCFEFLGRADDQVKLRGQRLEIGEINHAIRMGIPQVQDVATIVARHGSSGKDVLVSFLVGRNSNERGLRVLQDQDGLGAKAKSACRDRLPGYMVPTYFLSLSYIPLSSNNKAEVKELKRLFTQLSHEELMSFTAAQQPATTELGRETAKKLIGALSSFSDIKPEEIFVTTSIFDLGVDSITALQLSSLLRSQGFHTATPTVLIRNPVIADLVHALSKVDPNHDLNSVREARQEIQACHHRYRGLVCRELGVKPGDIEYIAPCSPLQQGIVSKAVTGQERGAYFNRFEISLGQDVSIERLRSAWDNLISIEAVLRSAFVNTPGGCVQVALKTRPPVWETHAGTSMSELDSIVEKKRHSWIAENDRNIATPLQLIYLEGLSFRKLVIHIFHAIYDGNSFDLMLQQVAATYQDRAFSRGPSFAESLVHGPLWKYDHCREFWVDHLRDWVPSPTPVLSRSEQKDPTIACRTLPTNKLENIRKARNVTLQSVLLALWTSTLQRVVAGDLTVGVVVAGRSINLPGVERTIGPLFNTVPFFSKAVQGRTWASQIDASHSFSTSTMSFQHIPLQSIQKWCSKGKLLFDNLFTFQLQQPAQDEGQPVPWEMMDSPPNPDFPLAFEATRMNNGELELLVVAQPQVADSPRLEELLDWLEESIDAAAIDSAQPLGPANKPISELLPTVQPNSASDSQRDVQAANFSWTWQALAIRGELAVMSESKPEEITALRTIFELGLDSIDVIKLSAKLRKKGIDLPASQIMRQQTISNMSQLLDESSPATEDESGGGSLAEVRGKLEEYLGSTGLDMTTVESVLPPTALQESMVAAMVQSEFEWYFNHDILEIAEGVEVPKLREAWARVIQQSPILRTGFHEVDDQNLDMAYCQVLLKDYAPSMREQHLAELSETQRVMDDATKVAKEGNAATNLFQLAFVTVGERRFLVVSIAHALYDGWSLDLMYQDLESAYRGNSSSRPPITSFLSKMMSSTTDKQREFWAEYLDGASSTLVPEAKDPGSTPSSASFRAEKPSATAYSSLSAFCKAQSISLQVFCQACWALVLARRTKMLDVTFGVILSGRDFDGAEDLMFPTINTVALRCILHGSVGSFLAYLEESMADIREFQAYPLRKAQMAAKTAGTDLFNSLLMLQKAPSDPSNQRLLKSIDGSAALDYPVCVEAEVVGDKLVWRVACQATYFSEEATNDLLSELETVVQFMASRPAADVLSFQEQGVSIGGLPTVPMKEGESDHASDEKPLPDDENWGSTEIIIREVLSQVSNLPLESVTASSSLYHLGLDSISAIKVSSVLRKQGVQIRPRDLLKATNIPDMALSAVGAPSTDEPSPQSLETWKAPAQIDVEALLLEESLSQSNVEAILPALPMQVYMMSVWQNTSGALFFPEFCYQIESTIDAGQVQAAWDALVLQTPILRTFIVPTGSRDMPFLQVITKERDSPLVQFSSSRDGDNGMILRLKIHHALYDGVSLLAIVRDLSVLLLDPSHKLERDMRPWAEKHCINPTLTPFKASRKEIWTSLLDGCTIAGTPANVAVDQHERVSYLRESAVADVARVQKNASRHGLGIQSVFFAAYAQALAKEGVTDLVFGIYLANRDAVEDSNALEAYPTLNLVPLRVKVDPTESMMELAKRIQRDINMIQWGSGKGGGTQKSCADVGLWEVADWTGIQVTSFVNFLSIPEEDPQDDSSIKLIQTPSLSQVSSTSREMTRLWRASRENSVREVYPTTVDVEAKIQPHGLDIGVFGPAQRLSDNGAAKLVDEIVLRLGVD